MFKQELTYPKLLNTKRILNSSFDGSGITILDAILAKEVKNDVWCFLNNSTGNIYSPKGYIAHDNYSNSGYKQKHAIEDLGLTIIPALSKQQFFEITNCLMADEIKVHGQSAFRGTLTLARMFFSHELRSHLCNEEFKKKKKISNVIVYYIQQHFVNNERFYAQFGHWHKFVEYFLVKLFGLDEVITQLLGSEELFTKTFPPEKQTENYKKLKLSLSNKIDSSYIKDLKNNLVENITLLDQAIIELTLLISPTKDQVKLQSTKPEPIKVKAHNYIEYLNATIEDEYDSQIIITRFYQLFTLAKIDYERTKEEADKRVFSNADIESLKENVKNYIKKLITTFNTTNGFSGIQQAVNGSKMLKSKKSLSVRNEKKLIHHITMLEKHKDLSNADIPYHAIEAYTNYSSLVSQNYNFSILISAFNRLSAILQVYAKSGNSKLRDVARESMGLYTDELQTLFDNISQECISTNLLTLNN